EALLFVTRTRSKQKAAFSL
ncbi:hypothetical protein ACEOAE_24580, partial [Escherichia coli]